MTGGHWRDRPAQVGPLAPPEDVPEWLRDLVAATASLDATAFTRVTPPPVGVPRPAAVLILFGDRPDGPDVLLLRRAETLPAHPGQVAFPGGAAEAADTGPVDTALREAAEETGVVPESVLPLALLPEVYVPVSRFVVSPVLGYWHTPGPVAPVDPGETAAVARVPIAHLADPANRFRVRHSSGYVGPAFAAPGMLVWGFTAGLLSGVLTLGGWERPWDETDVRDLHVALRMT
ncbi:NUDIX hydrolase [Goodfellowiella coeruleoviolacea]|uniref:NUDIX domain-containing protein n=1 Tax=Goodfellowiella coeruleoviolacea TaxID=334858 RepID=A0AAE3GB78_9PSEU|nr:CoA pyrophosphatase [Goodfellowiella coeruleoviolacea]MCP2164613.1 NUDIX domain-containing protein [Goodfellowiella coeruleoviolacea]